MDRDKGQQGDCTRLLLKAAQGDRAAFGRVHAALAPAVRDCLAARDGRLDAAARDELVQEVFLRAWTHRRRFRGRSSAKTYLFAIARNALNEHLREARRAGLVFPGDLPPELAASRQGLWIPADRPEDGPGDSFHEAFARACAKLSPPQRQAVDLDLIEALPRAQAARLAGCTSVQFRLRLHRAKKRLRRLLSDCPHPSR